MRCAGGFLAPEEGGHRGRQAAILQHLAPEDHAKGLATANEYYEEENQEPLPPRALGYPVHQVRLFLKIGDMSTYDDIVVYISDGAWQHRQIRKGAQER